jgi:hypothetical protein
LIQTFQESAMRRPRFRLRTLLIAAAVVGLSVGVLTLRQRSAEYRERAALHAEEKRKHMELVNFCGYLQNQFENGFICVDEYIRLVRPSAQDLADYRGGATEAIELARKELASERAGASYHENLKRKYDRAARYPWLSIEPDPPAPERIE